jgi:tetratricopeptide (TPR) repeat protein
LKSARPYLSFVTILFCLLFAVSCSTKKNTFVSRTFHDLAAHYNGFFNGRELVKASAKSLYAMQKDQYEKTLPIFKIGTDAQAKSVYPDMDEAIKKFSIAIQRNSMNIKGKEYCDWIDDNYLWIGKAQFYKHDFWAASETFQFVATEYKNSPIRYEAMIWLTKVYLQLGKTVDAEYLIDYLNNEPKMPREYFGLFYAVAADFSLQQNDEPNAILMLEKASIYEAKRDIRIRYLFILGQLYQRNGESAKAYQTYGKVISMNPPYEMAFNAKINRARNFDAENSNSASVKKQLLKMSKDIKNEEYLDQVYYALAGVSAKENDEPAEISYLNKSIRASVSNANQKALSYLDLGEIYFSKKDFIYAQAYYDSCLQNLTKDYPDYLAIADKKNGLTRLVENLKIILKQDSIQRISSMSAADREKFIDDLILAENEAKAKAKAEEALNKEKLGEEEESKNQALFDESSVRNRPQSQTAGGAWYFYNQATVSFGFNEFLKKWGDRKLEDNWRRKNKQSSAAGIEEPEEEEGPDLTAYNDSIAKLDDAKRKEVYMKSAVLADTAIVASNDKIIDAYYNIGIIYREQLKEYRLSVTAFETLNQRFPANKYLLPTYYNLYVTYKLLKDKEKADFYKDILLNEYPESEFAKQIINPNYWRETQKKTEILEVFYENTYKAYLNKQYASVIQRKETADELYPKNKLVPKFDYLKTLSIGKTKPLSQFEAALKNIVNSYPNDSVSYAAQNILDYINKQNKPAVAPQPVVAAEPDFVYNADTVHNFLLVFENKTINAETIKNNVSTFNTTYFSLKDLIISNAFLTSDKQYVIVKSFANATEALTYYDAFESDEEVLKGVDTNKIDILLITPANFTKLAIKKDLAGYKKFFDENYQQ